VGGSVSTLGLRSECNETLGEKFPTGKFILLKSSEKKMYKLFSLHFLFSTTELTQNTKTQ